MKRRVWFFLVTMVGLVMVLVPVLAACGKTPALELKTKEIHMLAYKWGYDPAIIVVPKESLVKLHITVPGHHHEAYENVHPEEEYHHGFSITGYNIMVNLPVEETEVEFLADKAGEFLFTCTVWCGISQDGKEGHHTMMGKLVVYDGENPPTGYTETLDGYHYLPRVDEGDHPHKNNHHKEEDHHNGDDYHK